MKRCTMLALALVLGCTILTGCRRESGGTMTVPPMTQAATEAATMPATQPTRPAVTEPATQDATSATDHTGSTAEATEGTTGESRARSRGMDPGWK